MEYHLLMVQEIDWKLKKKFISAAVDFQVTNHFVMVHTKIILRVQLDLSDPIGQFYDCPFLLDQNTIQ